ncbi:MAG: sulfotransferase, partial [Aureliella sp.]
HDQAATEEQHFMQVMLSLRAMTFGQSRFDREVYLRAYHAYQRHVEQTFAARSKDLLQFDSTSELANVGFEKLCEFLECSNPGQPFPNSNAHSQRPNAAFMQALAAGAISSQTGIRRGTAEPL